MTDTTQTGKIAIITGASRGLGRSMALHLAAQGVSILGTYRSREADAQAVAAEIRSHGVPAAMLPLDTGDTSTFPAFATTLTATLTETFGRSDVDFLVNNAGIGVYTPFADTTEEQFDDLIRVQLKGPYFLTQTLLPLIVDGGRILNVSTGLTRFTTPGYSAYAAAKGAIEVLTRYQAKELGTRRITVNTIAPGVIETDFAGGHARDNADLNRMLAGTISLGRVGLPDDIGAAVATLLGEGSGWITGQRIEVSGGQNL